MSAVQFRPQPPLHKAPIVDAISMMPSPQILKSTTQSKTWVPQFQESLRGKARTGGLTLADPGEPNGSTTIVLSLRIPSPTIFHGYPRPRVWERNPIATQDPATDSRSPVVATFGRPSSGANHLRSLPSPVAEVGLVAQLVSSQSQSQIKNQK